jgi:hypothetical protein
MIEQRALRAQLAEQKVVTAELPGAEGGVVLVASAGARILRLTDAAGFDHLWLHPALEAGQPVPPRESDGWLNFGGDRTWIAPELHFFVRDRTRAMETYAVPSRLDPGAYVLEAGEDDVRLAQTCTLRDYLGEDAPLRIEKTIRTAANPLRDLNAPELAAGAEYVGYSQVTTLALPEEAPSGARVGLWHLAQVPPGGVIGIPLTQPRAPRLYFGVPAPGQLEEMPAGVRLRVDGQTMLKIGLQAANVFGRMGYLRETGPETSALLIRNFAVNPSGQYLDAPWDDPTETELGYAAQCYTDDGALGGFGELEYHAPGVGAWTGLAACTDESQVWGFQGPMETISEIARQLLGPLFETP